MFVKGCEVFRGVSCQGKRLKMAEDAMTRVKGALIKGSRV